MKKHRIKRIIALSLVVAMSSALLSGYNYRSIEGGQYGSVTDYPDPNRETTDHTVTIVTDLSKTYNGEIVDTPIFKVDNMDTDTSMTYHYVFYYKKNEVTGVFEPHEEIPKEVGRYRVKITICPSGHGSIENPYAEGNRDFVIMGVSKQENSFAHAGYDSLRCPDTTILNGPHPTCVMTHGIPIYQYSQNEEGPYSDALPDVPGTWYVKAIVEEDNEFYRFESDPVSFVVKKAPNNWIKALTISDVSFGETPEPKAEAAHGTVKYQYSQNEEGSYTDVPPVFPGTWYVKASVTDNIYENLESAPVKFTVRAVNFWTEELSMSDITFGETPEPNASAVHGVVKYQYSQSEAGPYSDALPNVLGVWYVKAMVDGDTTYNGLESAPVRFEVKKEGNEWGRELTIANIALGEEPEPKADAAHGTIIYYYSQTETGPYTEELPNTRGTWYVKAVVAEGDTYKGLESAPVSFEVGKMKNAWTKELMMSDVILGDKPEPKAEAAHGNVRYQYSRNEEGPYADALPDVPGTWYVKAIVAENETYAPLESEPASFVLIDLDEYVPPLVEPDKPGNSDEPEEDKKAPTAFDQSEDAVQEPGGAVMTPTDAKDNTDGKTADKTVNGVKTGDNSPIVLIMICCVLSAGLGLGMLLKRRRKNV